MNQHPIFILPESDQTEAGAESERLLVSGAPWRGVLLDLYGSASDEWGYEVDDVALKHSGVSLVEWFNGNDLEHLSNWCNDHLPDGPELRALAEADDYDATDAWCPARRHLRH